MTIKESKPGGNNSNMSMVAESEAQHGLYQLDIQFDEALVAQDKDGNFVTDGARNARILTTGGSTRWNTGFPDWRNKETYGGTLRLQDSDTGEPMICSYIETSTKADCSIVIGEIPGRLIEARNSDTVGFGADNRVTNGHHAWSTWVKFHFQDYIYSARFTLYC